MVRVAVRVLDVRDLDAFPDEEAREAHLAGQVAGALKERAGVLLSEEPAIERIDILAGKLDTRALQPQPS